MNKILMYTNDKIYTTERMTGGIKRFKILYEGLISKGYNVTLYCGEDEQTLKKYNKNANSININNKKKFIFSSVSIMLNNIKLIKKIKKEKYDDVIVFDIPACTSLALMRLKNINLFLRQDLIEYRKIILNENKRGKIFSFFYLKFMHFCEYICLKHAKKIIVQCNYDLKNILKRHIFLRNKINRKSFVQINNVNALWIEEKSNQNIQNKIDHNYFNICFIGDFSSTRKGHDIFLSAMKEIINNSINVYVIGDGKYLYQEKEKLKKYNNIIFIGRVKNPIDFIKQSDLVVVPSKADSCPNTILEALYNNVLVIGSNAGGIPEILNDDDMLFELNSKILSKKVMNIIDDKEIYKKILIKQKKRREELCFDWVETIVNILLEGDVSD